MEKVIVWHKPNCSKCRDAVAYIKNRAVVVDEWREYLVDVPSEDDIRHVLTKLGIPAEKLVRTKEPIYREKFAGKKMTEAKWINALHKYPVLIQRPIIIIGNNAFFGRSEEDLQQLVAS